MADICRGISKFVLAIIGALFWLVSIFFFVIGGIIVVSAKHLQSFEGSSGLVTTTAAIVLACGFFWFLAGLAGCCTVCSKESKVLPGCFGVLLLVIVALMVGSSVLVMTSKHKVESGLKSGLFKEMKEFVGEKENGTEVADDDRFFIDIQKNLHCCGVSNATDWLDEDLAPMWYNKTGDHGKFVPNSCCKNCTDDYTPIPVAQAYEGGCESAMVDYIKAKTWWIAGVVIFLTVLMVIGFIGTCVLMCSNRSLPYSQFQMYD